MTHVSLAAQCSVLGAQYLALIQSDMGYGYEDNKPIRIADACPDPPSHPTQYEDKFTKAVWGELPCPEADLI